MTRIAAGLLLIAIICALAAYADKGPWLPAFGKNLLIWGRFIGFILGFLVAVIVLLAIIWAFVSGTWFGART